jgi:hypothetical protein
LGPFNETIYKNKYYNIKGKVEGRSAMNKKNIHVVYKIEEWARKETISLLRLTVYRKCLAW